MFVILFLLSQNILLRNKKMRNKDIEFLINIKLRKKK